MITGNWIKIDRKRSRKRIDALEISKKSRKKGKGEGKASQV